MQYVRPTRLFLGAEISDRKGYDERPVPESHDRIHTVVPLAWLFAVSVSFEVTVDLLLGMRGYNLHGRTAISPVFRR